MITRKKAISPIISVIILIVVAVIITTLILSWGTDFTNKSIDDTQIIFEETDDYLVNNTKIQGNNLSFKNISPKKTLTIIGYKILSNSDDSNFNTDVMLDEPIELSPGQTAIMPLIKLPSEKKMSVELLTSDNKKITLNNIINLISTTTENGGEDEEPEDPPVAASSEKDIIYFTINDTNGSIDTDNNTITFSFDYGTTITNLTPTIIISEDATISPESGVAHDFSSTVEYTVTAEDESTKVYTIIVNVSEIPDGIGLIPTNGEIWYLEHLDYIDTNSTTLAGAYTLMRDLNFSDDSSYYDTANKITWTTGNGWIPLGTSAARFKGVFNGEGHKISNLYINRVGTNGIGLFGYVNDAAVNISNVGLEDVNITGSQNVGAIIGYLKYGIANTNYSTGYISGTDNVGGVIGYIENAVVTNSYSDCAVNGVNYVGGLIGYSKGTTNAHLVSYSYSTGSVSGTSSYVGGLVGYVYDYFTISNSYSTSSVVGGNYVGGLVGFMWGYSSPAYISTITNSYSTGYVHGPAYNNYVGGLVGLALGYISITNSFWDMNTSDQTTSSAGNVKTTEQMKIQSTFTTWDFSANWNITEGSSYPYLINNPQSPAPTPIAIPSPIMIYDANDLYNIRNDISRTAYYKLANNIDLNVAPYNTGSGWTPIGTSAAPFQGVFDGDGYTISNLYISLASTDNIGLFGYTNKYTKISNVNLTNVNIIGRNNVGGLSGYIGYSLISNVSVSGNVSGTDQVGGFVGKMNRAMTTLSDTNCTVIGNSDVGGFVGKLEGTSNTNIISYSYSTGSVSGTSSYVGGFAGYLYDYYIISNSYSTSSVVGGNYVGGLVGFMWGYSSPAYISTITNSYSTGYVHGPAYNNYVGGLVGLALGYISITNSFWDMNTSDQTTSSAGNVKTTEQMKIQSTFTTWDFSANWNITEGSSYPYLINNPQSPAPTPIAIPSPIMIYDANDLYNIRNDISRTAYYKLANNIDLNVAPYNTGSGWTPIGTSAAPFQGVFDGDGYTISNLYISLASTDNIGLFGYTNKYTKISNVNLTNVNIIGRNNVGGLSGYIGYSLISNVSVSGNVSGTNYIGGFAGKIYMAMITLNKTNTTVNGVNYVGGFAGHLEGTSNTHLVSYSYSTGSVSGTTSYVGGFAGYLYNYYIISNCYSTSSVSGTGYVGGLVGYMWGHLSSTYISTVTNSHSSGSVTGSTNTGGLVGVATGYNSITNSFWDMNTSGKATSSAGTGKTTEQMKAQATFTSWDFSTIWNITENTTYPYLRSNTQSPLPQ